MPFSIGIDGNTMKYLQKTSLSVMIEIYVIERGKKGCLCLQIILQN